MASKYQIFDRSRLLVKPLAERISDLDAAHWLQLDEIAVPYAHPSLSESRPALSQPVRAARPAS